MVDRVSKAKRSEIMSKIRSRDTKPEVRFRENHPKAVDHPKLPYSPDFLLDGNVVFLDSTFWHGLLSSEKWRRLTEYWRGRLFRNIVRDECANSFWGSCGVGFRRVVVG